MARFYTKSDRLQPMSANFGPTPTPFSRWTCNVGRCSSNSDRASHCSTCTCSSLVGVGWNLVKNLQLDVGHLRIEVDIDHMWAALVKTGPHRANIGEVGPYSVAFGSRNCSRGEVRLTLWGAVGAFGAMIFEGFVALLRSSSSSSTLRCSISIPRLSSFRLPGCPKLDRIRAFECGSKLADCGPILSNSHTCYSAKSGRLFAKFGRMWSTSEQTWSNSGGRVRADLCRFRPGFRLCGGWPGPIRTPTSPLSASTSPGDAPFCTSH